MTPDRPARCGSRRLEQMTRARAPGGLPPMIRAGIPQGRRRVSSPEPPQLTTSIRCHRRRTLTRGACEQRTDALHLRAARAPGDLGTDRTRPGRRPDAGHPDRDRGDRPFPLGPGRGASGAGGRGPELGAPVAITPSALHGVRIVEAAYRDRPIGALAERSGRRLTAVLACRAAAFSLLDPEAQERRLAPAGLGLSGAASRNRSATW